MAKAADKSLTGRTAVSPASKNRAPLRLENVSLPAKIFLPASESESACIVIDLSVEGATISVAQEFDISTELVLYVEGFDRFSASVVSSSQQLTSVKFKASPHKRERIAEKIAGYLSGKPLRQTKSGQSSLSAIASVRTLHRPNGTVSDFEVIDISLLGASLRTSCRPLVGEIITIGTSEGRVTRYIDDGIVVEFIRSRKPSPGARAGNNDKGQSHHDLRNVSTAAAIRVPVVKKHIVPKT